MAQAEEKTNNQSKARCRPRCVLESRRFCCFVLVFLHFRKALSHVPHIVERRHRAQVSTLWSCRSVCTAKHIKIYTKWDK